ncbi:MAG: apolipoprotein N-acyltransferase [Pseudomonadota bacterium]|nr:apolipoprotein N-acyltransferase [Pseudomonadota bacterium]
MKTKIFFDFLFLGLILGISYSFIFLLPVIVFIYFSFLKKIYKIKLNLEGFVVSWVFGTGFFIGSMHWMVNPFLVYEKHFYLLPLGALVFPVLMGLFFTIPTSLIILSRKYFQFLSVKIFLNSFVVSFFFFLSEILRSKLFGGLPLNLTAQIWAFNSELIQGAKIFGVYGISFLTILWLILISNLLIEKKIKTSVLTIFFFPLILLSFNLLNKDFKKKNEVSIRVVQPNISQSEKWNRVFFEKNIERLINLSLQGNDMKTPKIVVWPEVALTLYLNEELEFVEYLRDKLPPNITLVTGALRRVLEDNKFKIYNSLYVINDDIVFHYDKKKLVPFGEFIPLRNFINFLKLTPGSTDFSAGVKPSHLEINFENKKISFEPSICYEAIFQTFYDKDSELMINITNDAWFGKTIGPRQHLSSQIFRAVEKSTPLVRSANSGISVVTDENGKIFKKILLNTQGFIDVRLSLKKSQTFFEKNKNYSTVILIFLVFLLFYLIDIFYHLKMNPKSKI